MEKFKNWIKFIHFQGQISKYYTKRGKPSLEAPLKSKTQSCNCETWQSLLKEKMLN